MRKYRKMFALLACALLLVTAFSVTAFAATGGAGAVTSAIEGTWNSAKGEVKNVVNNVVFPVLDLILAVLFFVKLGSAYFDYKKHGDFQWARPQFYLPACCSR